MLDTTKLKYIDKEGTTQEAGSTYVQTPETSYISGSDLIAGVTEVVTEF